MVELYTIVNKIINLVKNTTNSSNEGELFLTVDSLVREAYNQGMLAAYKDINCVMLTNNKDSK